MKRIELLLENDEIALLRLQARMMQLMVPESNEQIDQFIDKILKATFDLDDEWKKEIGKMQRAVRRVKNTPEYVDMMDALNKVEKRLMEEIKKE